MDHRQSELQEPLLRRQRSTDQQTAHGDDDEEVGQQNVEEREVDASSIGSSVTSTAIPIRQQAFRPTTIHVVVVDLIMTITLSIVTSDGSAKSAFFDFRHFVFSGAGGSVIDIIWMSIVRGVILLVQTSMVPSLRAAKVAGYTTLICLLYIITKISCAVSAQLLGLHVSTLPYTALLLTSAFFCVMECLCEMMICFFSSQDLSSSVAPTEDEAAEGIAVDATKRISMWQLIKTLSPYFWPDGLLNRVCVFLTWCFLILAKVSNICAPLFIAKATDELASSHLSATTNHVILYAVLLLSNKVFKELQAIAYIRVKLIAGMQLQERVFTHILALSMDWHQRKSMGAVNTAIQRGINASNMVVQYIFLYLLPTMIEACIVTIIFVQAFRSPLLAAVATCGCTLYTAVTIELTLFRMQYRKRMNKASNDASHRITDALLNIEIVKYFAAEDNEADRYRDSVNAYQESAYRIQGSLSILNTCQQIVLNGTLVTALLVAAHEYTTGDMTIGQFVAVNVYIIQLFAPLNFLGSIYSMAVGSYIDLQNLCNILAEKPGVEDHEDALDLNVADDEPLDIDFQDVSFSYPSRKEVNVLKGVSFKVPARTTTAIVGATGAGKSTITRLLFRFYEASRGSVLVGGQNVVGLTQSSLRRSLGVVPQDHMLFNDSLRYNILYGSRNASDNELRRAIQSAELEDFVSGLPKGLETLVGERGQQVSGGQKQRIAIARVLIKDSPICVLDEATSSLDSRTELKIQQSFDALKGRTLLVIAHRLSTIQNADQIIVMSNGEILESGSHQALLAKGVWHEQCYASLWDKQRKDA